MNLKLYGMVLFSLVVLSACGGSDDGGGSSSVDTLSAMPANASLATASTTNTEDMVNSDKSTRNARSSSQTNEENEKVVKLKLLKKNMLSMANNSNMRSSVKTASKATISDTFTSNCSTSGTTTGSYTYDTTTYIANFTMIDNNCVEGNKNYNGSVEMKVNYTSNSLDSYSELEFKIGSSGYTISSTISSFSLSMAANSYHKEYDITSYDISADEPLVYKEAFYFMAKANNEVFYEDSIVQNLTSTKYYYISGDFYISDSEYLMVDTRYDANATPFEIDSSYNIIDGTAQFVGENNGTIQIDITTSNTATIRIDADNDNVWESEQTGVDVSNFGW